MYSLRRAECGWTVRALFVFTLWLCLLLTTILDCCAALSLSHNNRDEIGSDGVSTSSLVKIEPLHPLCTHCSDGTAIQIPALKSPSNDCFTGHYIRLPVNSSCHCQLVCGHTSRQPCRVSSITFDNVAADVGLCDKTLNLSCNQRTNRCEGEFLSFSLSLSPPPPTLVPFICFVLFTFDFSYFCIS